MPKRICSLAALMFSLVAAAPAQTTTRYQILYTGRTLGYARIPDQQTLPASTCGPNAIAQQFLDQFAYAAKTASLPQVRLGMGDNFSPDLYGRSILLAGTSVPQCDGAVASGMHIPKDYFGFSGDLNAGFWSLPGSPNIPGPFTDNVADFYFGPEYLKQIGRYLTAHGTRLLGANLIVASSVAPGPMNAHPRIPERLANPCHYDTGKTHPCYTTSFGPASLDLPDNVLPWKRVFVLHGARQAFIPGTHDLFRADELGNFKASAVQYTNIFNLASARICSEAGPATSGDPSDAFAKCMPVAPAESVCRDSQHPSETCKAIYGAEGRYDATKQTATTDVTFVFRDESAHLNPGLNHVFCLDSPNAKDVAVCQPFAVQIPMFWPMERNGGKDSAAQGTPDCSANTRSGLPCPYLLTKQGVTPIAVFGVVDPDLLSNVGMANASWLNTHKSWDTSARVTAPDYALLQTLDLCNLDPTCRSAPKILMAQMSYARATQLLANSNFSGVFDVVLTQVSAEHDTGDVELHYTGSAPRFSLTASEPRTQISVGGSWSQNAQEAAGRRMSMQVFTPRVYMASIEKINAPEVPKQSSPASTLPAPDAAPKPQTQWSLRNESIRDQGAFRDDWCASHNVTPCHLQLNAAPLPFCASADEQNGKCVDLKHLSEVYLQSLNGDVQAQKPVNPSAGTPLTQTVLAVMQKATRADVVMIQRRDLFDADALSMEQISAGSIQDQLSRVVWKGDQLVVLQMTGGTIRKMLQQSASFAQSDSNALTTEVEHGRDLITLGVYQDPDDADVYYINGSVMNDTTLYSVATTDFISGGDTGYSLLSPPDVLPALRVEDFAFNVRKIAVLTCDALQNTAPANVSSIHCLDFDLNGQYYDDSELKPTDATPGFNTARRYLSFFRTFLPPRRPYANAENTMQQRHFWYLNLENFDFGESGTFIDHFSRTAPALAGISNPLVANKNTQNLGADYKIRGVLDYRVATFYLLNDLSFLYNNTVALNTASSGVPTVAPGSPALTYNVLGYEAGGTIRLSPNSNREGLVETTPKRIQRPSWLSLQYSIRYENEVIDPFPTQVTLTPGSGSYVYNLILQTPKANTIYGRGGIRIDDGSTYLETGLEEIDSRNLLASYTIQQPGGANYYCFPQPGLALGCGRNPHNAAADTTLPSSLILTGAPSLSVMPQTTSYRNPGAYVNFYWTFPLWSRRDGNRVDQSFYFTITNKGDIYFNSRGDTPVQTRYLDRLTPALNIPLWAGLSLTPKLDVILYMNKVDRFHYLALQPSVALSYTFSWRQGMNIWRALRYGAQTTTPSPAGALH